jgi:hypothetical protein
MRQALVFDIVGVTAVIVGSTVCAISVADKRTAIHRSELPSGYRDWRLISVAHEEGNLNDIRAILGNDVAIAAFRAGKLPLPDGAIIARLAWSHVSSAENDRAFGRAQSFVAGTPTNVQFMAKDSRKYASTGGWEFAQFTGGKFVAIAAQGCLACHLPAKTRDYVFTSYSP